MITVITIDGPSGAGKSTVARRLSSILGYDYIDSGALYRIVALEAIQKKIDGKNDKDLLPICEDLKVNFLVENGNYKIIYQGRDVSDSIRTPEISMLASRISAKKVVRDRLSALQRRMGKRGHIVLEGRDAGTVVFPDAPVKFFLDATPKERGRRRFEELRLKGIDVNLAQVTNEVMKRDENDRSRRHAPLVPASDAVIIDSSHMTVEDVVTRMTEVIQKKLKGV